MARPGKSRDEVRPPPRLRRAYYDCRHGQLHLHNAIPAGGGFDELTPVICLHGSGETARAFAPLLAPLGQERSVYALDTPGAGESDPAPGETATSAAVHAVTDFVDSMRIRSFDLLARGDAAAAALQLLELRGVALRRIVLLAPPAGIRVPGTVEQLPAPAIQAQDFVPRLLQLLSHRT